VEFHTKGGAAKVEVVKYGAPGVSSLKGVPKSGAAEVEAVQSGAPEVSLLGWSSKGWSS
jgi:hypothetical protein